MNTENAQPDPTMDADLSDALGTRVPRQLVDRVFEATAESLPVSETLEALNQDLIQALRPTPSQSLEDRLFCATVESLPRDAMDQRLEEDLSEALRAGSLPAGLNQRIEHACRARLKHQPTILARLGSWGFSSVAAALVLVAAIWALRPASPAHTDVVAVLEAIHQLESNLPSDALTAHMDQELLTLRMEIDETELGLNLDRMNDALGLSPELLGHDLDLLELELDAMF